MKFKIYYENRNFTQGGYETVSLLKLVYWLVIGKIKPTDNSDRYYIRKIENNKGDRI